MRKVLCAMMALVLGATAISTVARADEWPAGMSKREIRKATRAGVSARALKSVCKSVSSIAPGQMLVKSELSNHISAPGDSRQGGYTLVCGNQCAKLPASIFYSDGNLAARLGYYGTFSGNGKPRAYCGVGTPSCNARSIAGVASRKKTGKLLYLQTNPKTKSCKSFNASGRNGGV
jgi:hypothetical protein